MAEYGDVTERQMDSWQIDRAFGTKSPFGMGSEPTYSGALSMLRRQYTKDLTGVDVAVSGIPFDLAVSNRTGTRFGPRAIRAASTNLAWDGGAWRWPFDPFADMNVIDYGDCDFDPGLPDLIPAAIEAHADEIIASGAKMVTLGGDHFVTYPILKAHAKKYGPIALVQFDAHSDTWKDPIDETGRQRIDHGTMFYHAVNEGIIDSSKSVQYGIRTGNANTHGFTVLNADWAHEHTAAEAVAEIVRITDGMPTYITFDIDCLDPAFAPGTGTPVCGGLSSWKAEKILSSLTELNLIGMDVVEVSPAYDVGEVTALTGATMALNGICLMADRKRRGL